MCCTVAVGCGQHFSKVNPISFFFADENGFTLRNDFVNAEKELASKPNCQSKRKECHIDLRHNFQAKVTVKE